MDQQVLLETVRWRPDPGGRGAVKKETEFRNDSRDSTSCLSQLRKQKFKTLQKKNCENGATQHMQKHTKTETTHTYIHRETHRTHKSPAALSELRLLVCLLGVWLRKLLNEPVFYL